jgi:hypothetical protein
MSRYIIKEKQYKNHGGVILTEEEYQKLKDENNDIITNPMVEILEYNG